MQKRSVLVKIMILVMLAIAVPAISSAAGDVACEFPYCQGACPANTYDCTSEWIYASWDNFQAALAVWYSGYSLLICCNV